MRGSEWLCAGCRCSVSRCTALAAPTLAQPARPGCTLRIATTLAALPTQNGGPDQGTEGIRFMGYTLYDPLIGWDLSHADRAATLRPSIATAWTVDAQDRTRWTITVRDGIHFHDGSLLDAAAVVWNLDKLFNRDAPQYDREQAAQMTWRMPAIKASRVIDPQHLEITTNGIDSTLPYQLTALLISSPARWQQAGSMGRIQQASRRHRAVGPAALRRAGKRRAGAQRRLLGQGARATLRQARAAAGSRPVHAHGGVAERASRLDRGAGAGHGRRSFGRRTCRS